MNYQQINKLAIEFEKQAKLEKQALPVLAIIGAAWTISSIAGIISSHVPAFKNLKDGIRKAISLVSGKKDDQGTISSFIKNGQIMLSLLDTVSSVPEAPNENYILALNSFSSAASNFLNNINVVDAILSKNQTWYQRAGSIAEDMGLTFGISTNDISTARKVLAQLAPQLTITQSTVENAINKFKQAIPEAQQQIQESKGTNTETPNNNVTSKESISPEANEIFEELAGITF
jgi:hypothetical protein